MNSEKCPYCGQKMTCGRIFGVSGRGVYWLPDGAELNAGCLTSNAVEGVGGLVLGTVRKAGFLSKERPATWCCSGCRVMITGLSEPK